MHFEFFSWDHALGERRHVGFLVGTRPGEIRPVGIRPGEREGTLKI